MPQAKNETINTITFVNLAPSNGANSPAQYRGSVASLPIAEQPTMEISARGLKGKPTREVRVLVTVPVYDAEKGRRMGTVSEVRSVRFSTGLTQAQIDEALKTIFAAADNATVKESAKTGYVPQ